MRKMWVEFAKTGNPSLSADISPDGMAYEWPLYDPEKKEVMVFDEFNIHPEKESERKMVDWERMYPLTMVLISDHTKGLYEDKWYGDVLHRYEEKVFFLLQTKPVCQRYIIRQTGIPIIECP